MHPGSKHASPDSTTPLLGINISRLGFEDTLQLCRNRVNEGKGGFVCFTNVHTVTEGSQDPELKQALGNAFLCAPDGVPLIWLSRIKGDPIAERVCGPDFTRAFMERWPKLHHGFIGGPPGLGEKITAQMGLNGTSLDTPMRPFSVENALEDWTRFLARFQEGHPDVTTPDVVWIGLGAPKQELWMNAIAPIAPGTLFFGVGAAFDFLIGTKQRAPFWMQKSGLEWMYRLGQEPGRLWKRYLTTNLNFISRSIADVLKPK